ncbi:hypothetical protein L7F22_064889 [Adiantum nelumboides]|nr:hypothetical protein [Adiantum nelumboides]
MTEPDRSRWVVIYPVYLNSKKTLAEGRRIGLSQSCENPTASEIAEICGLLNFAVALEDAKSTSWQQEE